jgi:hypothetical protein
MKRQFPRCWLLIMGLTDRDQEDGVLPAQQPRSPVSTRDLCAASAVAERGQIVWIAGQDAVTGGGQQYHGGIDWVSGAGQAQQHAGPAAVLYLRSRKVCGVAAR